jgi:DNA polymerase I-like protein with 3'-5' exonuclease and polymerase domains
MQLPLFEPKSEWKPPQLSELPSWKGKKRICIDVETRDEQLRKLGPGVRRGGYIVGISFTIEDEGSYYLPYRHAGGDNLPVDAVLSYMKENAKVFTGDLVGANLSYDLDYLWEEGIFFPNVRFYRDIQIADPLIYELHNSYSLDNIAKRLGLAGKDETQLRIAAKDYGVDPKGGMWKLPARHVGAYAEADTQQPLLVLRRQERLIDEQDLWDIYDLESKVLPVLVKMRRRGVLIDQDKLSRVEEWSTTQEKEALSEVKRLSGVAINLGDVWKAEAIAPALENIGIKVGKTAKTNKPSVDKDFLTSVDHPVAKSLLWARKTNKLRTTFAASVRRYMTNGRIHCEFNQIARENEDGEQKGARFGRLSCTNPNLQQQPSRDEFAQMWRDIYIPEQDAIWCANDYSQQEPRWTTHFAAVMGLPGAKAAAQAYHDDPLLDNHQFMSDLTGLPRKAAKNIYLGLCYGEGGAKLCRELGLPTRWASVFGRGRDRKTKYYATREEALEAKKQVENGYIYEAAGEEGQNILNTFDNRAPFIRQLAKKAQQKAAAKGQIRTGGGRVIHFPEKKDGSYDWCHKALNRLIQGTSADQTKKALVALDEAGYFMQLQVHDEIDGSVATEAEAHAQAKIMREIMPSEVPFRVDTELGKSWGDSMG